MVRDDRIHRGDGGRTVFLGGNVRFDREATFTSLEGNATPNILETVTPKEEIYSPRKSLYPMAFPAPAPALKSARPFYGGISLATDIPV